MSGPFRQSDAVLTIAQDNGRRAIEITAANEVAGKIAGYPAEELMGMPFSRLLPAKIAEMIEDYVEFEAGANDVGDVLRKVRDFQLHDKDGKDIPLRVRIVRHHSQEHDEFMLIMHNEEQERENDTVLTALRENFTLHAATNPDTGLPDRVSYEKGLELAIAHRERITNGVCAAVFQMDDYEGISAKYGVAASHKAMQEIAALCSHNLRGNDAVAQITRDRLGLILVGASREPAKMVLNRLRWLIAGLQIRTEQGIDIKTTASIVFREIDASSHPDEMLAHFEQTLDDKPADSINIVVEA